MRSSPSSFLFCVEVYVPTYSYRCANCDFAFDQHQAFTDDSLTVCPNCGEAQLRKVFNAIGVSFKGSGFYRTDSRAKPGGRPGKHGHGSSGSEKTGAEKASTEKTSTEKASTSSSSSSSDSSSSSTTSKTAASKPAASSASGPSGK
jgi:putative FmdB family regulatory protein